MDFMSEHEYNAFMAACEEGTLCDEKYCPYMAGKTSRREGCDGDWCQEAWENYCDEVEVYV